MKMINFKKKIKGKEISKIIIDGGVGVIPTDTIYGLVASAFNIKAVEKVYHLRHRQPDKPCIILISQISDLKKFNIKLSIKLKNMLSQIWPNSISVILPCSNDNLKYLHRGTKSLAFRLPRDKKLRDFLKITGPLIAPSANWEGKEPAKTIQAAKKYFKNEIDFYLDGGKRDKPSSTLITYQKGKFTILRLGSLSKKLCRLIY
ncbi:MAG: L-threonylcarbamoyladenylate synthase [Candidatus Parcubacteria bacterium]|nr:L-threonylcarbamoyladenylate synthase [Candidatus Parcubacteria bacterium]